MRLRPPTKLKVLPARRVGQIYLSSSSAGPKRDGKDEYYSQRY